MKLFKQYVGKTTCYMHHQHGGHSSKVMNQSSELGEISLQIIDCVKEKKDEALGILDGIWQNMIATFQTNDGIINVRN